jgi:hypothetical protein
MRTRTALGASALAVAVAIPTCVTATASTPAVHVSAGSTVTWVSYHDGVLDYGHDAQGNRLPDFSYAGYANGDRPIPTVPVRIRLRPTASGDDTARIQRAVDAVSKDPLGADGLRGAVYLAAGEYRVSGALTVTASGVELIGAGDGAHGTRLVATGAPRAVVTFAGSGSLQRTGAPIAVTDAYVPVGATSFHVASTAGLRVGESIVVQRPQEQSWIDAIGMNDIPNRTPWRPNSGLEFERTITAVHGDRVSIDIPLTNALEKQYTRAVIWPYQFSGRISDVGIEDMSANGLAFTGATGYAAGGYFQASFVSFHAVDDGWARDLVADEFGSGLGGVAADAKRISIIDTAATGMQHAVPQQIHAQPAAYTLAGQQSLVYGCEVVGSNLHAWVTEARTAGPDVFSHCTAYNTGDRRFDAGPHQRWGTGTLFDDIVMRTAPGAHDTSAAEMTLTNRYQAGSGQGWAGANDVLWNTDTDTYAIQGPPTAHNWAFGARGTQVSPGTPGADGTVVSAGTPMLPASLYDTQVANRLGH